MADKLKLPVGIEDFREIRRKDFYYIDKTRLIEQLLDSWGKVNLFTRPRRFGKTLNMSMLRYFFEIGTDKTLFEGLHISQRTALLMGLMVYILNEYRMDQKKENNNGLKHITVLEEAHNLLKNTSNNSSELVGKSVEMLTQTIAEIRTYGEGFIIVDQSPSSVDIAAIKNTNTKIVLRTPEANDREAVGRSMGLNENQVNEIAKLPSGVAVVYQNDWVSPVLTMIDKAKIKETTYVNTNPVEIMSVRKARTDIIKAIMEPWIPGKKIDFSELAIALNSLEVSRTNRKLLAVMLYTYKNHNGHILWNENSLDILRQLLLDILGISQKSIGQMIEMENPDTLRREVSVRTNEFTAEQIDEICFVLSSEV